MSSGVAIAAAGASPGFGPVSGTGAMRGIASAGRVAKAAAAPATPSATFKKPRLSIGFLRSSHCGPLVSRPERRINLGRKERLGKDSESRRFKLVNRGSIPDA
jgi:hypothetical protein